MKVNVLKYLPTGGLQIDVFQCAAYPKERDIAVLTATSVHRLVNQVASTAALAAGCAEKFSK